MPPTMTWKSDPGRKEAQESTQIPSRCPLSVGSIDRADISSKGMGR